MPIAGGNWNNGANAGVFNLNLNNARSNSNSNIGFRSALSLNQKTCIRPINQGIEFVGYRLWYNKVVLRKSTTLGMKRSLRGVANKYHDYEMTLEQVTQTFNSYTGMLEHTDSEELLASLYTDMILTHGERRENEERFIQMLP